MKKALRFLFLKRSSQPPLKRLENYLTVESVSLFHNKFLFFLLSFTWGIIMTSLGFIFLFFCLPFGKLKKSHHGLHFVFKKRTGWAFGMGIIIFSDPHYDCKLMEHEFGHLIQNAVLGPFMIFLVAIPSSIRCWYRMYLDRIKRPAKTLYDDIWFERNATRIGDLYHDYVIFISRLREDVLY